MRTLLEPADDGERRIHAGMNEVSGLADSDVTMNAASFPEGDARNVGMRPRDLPERPANFPRGLGQKVLGVGRNERRFV